MVALLVRVFEGWPRQLPGADPAAFFRWKHLELEQGIDPDPTDTASWALSYGDLELL